jgi:hypothetical protein
VPPLWRSAALGIKNIHIHKGPPQFHPLNMDAFDVRDVDEIATAFPDLNFISIIAALPRVEIFAGSPTRNRTSLTASGADPSLYPRAPNTLQK